MKLKSRYYAPFVFIFISAIS